MAASNLRKIDSVTILNGQSLSAALNLGGNWPIGFQMSAAWTAANLTFQGSNDGTTFQNVFDDLGNEVTVIAVAAHNIGLTESAQQWLAPFGIIKVRSGTSGTPVNQGADRVIGLVSMPGAM